MHEHNQTVLYVYMMYPIEVMYPIEALDVHFNAMLVNVHVTMSCFYMNTMH